MSRRDQDKVREALAEKTSLTFCDVSAYFSEEDWNLLHEWQQELYKNVMNEIHQALISLGPLIASSVISLKTKENQDHSLTDHEDSESRHSTNLAQDDTTTNSASLFEQRREKKHSHWEEEERNDCLVTGFPNHNADICLRMDEESSADFVEHFYSEGNTTSPRIGHKVNTPSPPFCIKEERRSLCINSQDYARKEDLSSLIGNAIASPVEFLEAHGEENRQPINTEDDSEWRVRKDCFKSADGEHTSFPSVVSFNIKEEEDDAYSVEDSIETVECRNSQRAGDIVNRPSNPTDSTRFAIETQSRTALSGRMNESEPQNSEMLTDSRSQLWPQCKQGLEGNTMTHFESIFHNPSLVNFPHTTTKTGTLYKDNGRERNLRNAVLSTCVPKTQQIQRPYMCTGYEKNFSQKRQFAKLKRTHTEVAPQDRPHQCTDCDKSFSLKCDLNRHWRTHTGEKPYKCTYCPKSFSLKGDLNRHQRIHTGEKPFTCTDCQRSFSRKYILSVHKRTHIQKTGYQSEKSKMYYKSKGYSTGNRESYSQGS